MNIQSECDDSIKHMYIIYKGSGHEHNVFGFTSVEREAIFIITFLNKGTGVHDDTYWYKRVSQKDLNP